MFTTFIVLWVCVFVFCYFLLRKSLELRLFRYFFLEIDKTITFIGGCTELRILLEAPHGELIQWLAILQLNRAFQKEKKREKRHLAAVCQVDAFS